MKLLIGSHFRKISISIGFRLTNTVSGRNGTQIRTPNIKLPIGSDFRKNSISIGAWLINGVSRKIQLRFVFLGLENLLVLRKTMKNRWTSEKLVFSFRPFRVRQTDEQFLLYGCIFSWLRITKTETVKSVDGFSFNIVLVLSQNQNYIKTKTSKPKPYQNQNHQNQKFWFWCMPNPFK